jgi:peptide/nickel transport system permease protein
MLRSVARPLRYPMVVVVVRRVVLAIPLLFVVSALTWVLVGLIPGNPAVNILGPDHPQAAYAALNKHLGVDRPLYERYVRWAGKAVRGDLGESLYSNLPVTQTIRERFGVTLSLVLTCLLAISTLGVALGVFGALRGGFLGRFVDGLSLLGFAIPSYWLGAVLIGLFAVTLRWFPAVGYVPFAESPSEWARALVLPVTALALRSLAVLAKQTREAMIDVLASEHVRMARASGIPGRYIYFRLALKNTAIRVVTIIGLEMIGLLLGTVFIEQVFAIPGLGSALVIATQQQDLPLVQGITVFFTLIIIAVNLVVDLLYTVLDPRVRSS